MAFGKGDPIATWTALLQARLQGVTSTTRFDELMQRYAERAAW